MTEMLKASSLEAYNARWLTPPQVASTFVPPAQFGELAKQRHSLLVGPRGSGKTTLLKMLQPAALERWNGLDAEYFRSFIDFTGVFIPADISWRRQLDAVGTGIGDPQLCSLFSDAAFSTHILQAVVETMYFRASIPPQTSANAFRRCEIDKETEATIVSELSASFIVRPAISTLLSLKHALSSRLAEIQGIAQRVARLGDRLRDELAELPFLFLDPLTVAGHAVEVFDDATDDPYGKWALLFDELEIAPEGIQRRLIDGTRSTNQKFLFKLALSPFSGHRPDSSDGVSPSPSNDFDQIQLWYAHKEQRGASEQRARFCGELWKTLVPIASPRAVLGGGYFESDSSSKHERKNVNPYAPMGKWGKCFIRLYSSDATFKRYLDDRNIDPARILELPPTVRASAIRKVTPIVVVREFYRRPQLSEEKLVADRSRKGVDIYTGAEALFDISEGHPRWFKVMIGRLLARARGASSPVVSPSIQGQELLAAAQRFSALLRTFPARRSGRIGGNRGLLSLVSAIGNYFRDQVVKAPFSSEPYLSFIVDSNVDEELLDSLAQALNLGALVYVPEGDGEVLLTSLRGKRFRISYWLAPLYGLPLILGKQISLSRILSDGSQRDSTFNVSQSLDLPFDSEGTQ
jgi:energy-coupling factor transporter ATP-binding protein EcfA2